MAAEAERRLLDAAEERLGRAAERLSRHGQPEREVTRRPRTSTPICSCSRATSCTAGRSRCARRRASWSTTRPARSCSCGPGSRRRPSRRSRGRVRGTAGPDRRTGGERGPGVGPAPRPGPTTRGWTPSCSRPATGATSPTATATGARRRSPPTSTPAGTRSTSRSRTGSTTSTSAPSSATPTRSWPPRCTSSAAAAGTAAARWSPTATSTSATTPRSTLRGVGGGGRRCPCSASTTCPARWPIDGYALPRALRAAVRPGGPGAVGRGARAGRGGAGDPPVRLDPVDQRRRRLGGGDARVGAPPRPRARRDQQRLDTERHRPGGCPAASTARPRRRPRRPSSRRRGRPTRPRAARRTWTVSSGLMNNQRVPVEDGGDAVAGVGHREHALQRRRLLARDHRDAQPRPHRRRAGLAPGAAAKRHSTAWP